MNFFRRLFGMREASAAGSDASIARQHVIETEGLARSRDDVPAQERAGELDRVPSDTHGDPDSPTIMAQVPMLAAQWRVAKSLLALRDQVNQMAPNRDKSSDGTIGDAAHCGGGGTSDHCPNVQDGAMGVVTAMDLTHDKPHGCDAGKIAELLRDSRDPRIKYIIWNRRISNAMPIGGQPAWAWRTYNGANPHDKHVHVSVRSTKTGAGGYDTTTPWTIPSATT